MDRTALRETVEELEWTLHELAGATREFADRLDELDDALAGTRQLVTRETNVVLREVQIAGMTVADAAEALLGDVRDLLTTALVKKPRRQRRGDQGANDTNAVLIKDPCRLTPSGC